MEIIKSMKQSLALPVNIECGKLNNYQGRLGGLFLWRLE